MLLMSVTSALAENLANFGLTEYDGWPPFEDEHFTVSGDWTDVDGMWIHNGCKINIKSNNGEIITKVVCTVTYGVEYVEQMIVSDGTPNFRGGVTVNIDDVNATSLEISSDVEGEENYFQIDHVAIYYETANNEEQTGFVVDKYVQFETFNTTPYTGRNVSVTGTNKNFTITSNDGSGVEIRKVDLTVNGSVTNTTAGVIEGSGTDWSINNVSATSLTVTTSEDVSSIKVYYVKRSEEVYYDIVNVTGGSQVANYTIPRDELKITGTKKDGPAFIVNNGESVTITSDDDREISKVDLRFSYYYDNNTPIESTAGEVAKVDRLNWSINNVNSSSLTISHPGKQVEIDDWVTIDRITVYYKEKIVPTIIASANHADGAWWTTFYGDDGNYQAPEGTKVFAVNLNGTSISMTEIKDGIVKKGEGVVLKSMNDGYITMTKTDNEANGDYTNNSLLGTSVNIENPGNAYVLNWQKSNGVGFYKLKAAGTIAANKAYLVYDATATGEAQAFFAFDSAVTGVEINKADANEDDNKVYDLQGRRVTKPANGLYIVNGKKVIMK